MTANSPDSERRLLPRWRTAQAAIAAGELKTPPMRVAPAPNIHFEELLAEWKRSPDVETAAELVSSAWALNRLADAEAAARFLSRDDADATPLLREISARALADSIVKLVPAADFAYDRAKMIAHIGAQKRRTRRTPRNPIAWMDLAHAHTVVGQKEKAEHAIRIALALAPENRFVLRASARFFVHTHELEHAVDVLRNSLSIRTDPWIMSAEIALSSVVQQTPHSYKRARVLLDADALDPWHTGELHGAFGTMALLDRGVGKARKFFVKSLRRPTENAVAQAQWAANGDVALEVPSQLLTQDHAFEALALKARSERRWHDAIQACRQWSAMEPTSTRPLNMGAFIAEVALHDGRIALEFTRRMLMTAPEDPMSLNNHIVALTYAGDQPKAEEYFERLSRRSLSPDYSVVRLATEGLLAFRAGRVEAGERLYLDAFERAAPLKDRELSALVLWHLLRESARVGAEGIQEITAKLWETTRDISLPELTALHQSIHTQLANDQKQNAILPPAARRHLPPLPAGHFLHLVDKDPHA